MSEHKLTPLQIQAFARHLLLEEKSAATMEKYLRDIRAFACWLGDREICKELTAEESLSGGAGLRPRQYQCHALCLKQPVGVP